MAYIGMTGQGITVAFTTLSGGVGCARSIQLPEWVRDAIDASCLSTTDWMQFIPADLSDPGEVEITAVFDPDLTLPDPGDLDDLTITFPAKPGSAVQATLEGNGFFSSVGFPSVTVNGLLELTIRFKLDGDTDGAPTYTPGSVT